MNDGHHEDLPLLQGEVVRLERGDQFAPKEQRELIDDVSVVCTLELS